MEQHRLLLTYLKKYHFWLINAAILIAVVVCWWMATNSLAGQFQTRKDKIKSAFSSVNIQADSPNATTIQTIQKLEAAAAEKVYAAWQTLYDEQKKKNPIPAKLGESFRQQFENLQPGESLSRRNRDIYMNYIKEYIPTLLKIIDARRPSEESAAANRPMAGVGQERFRARTAESAPGRAEMIGVVDWDDYEQLMKHFTRWQSAPTTLEILIAQEDLWVYQALLEVIKNTNGGATSQMNAPVKRIQSLEIGQKAVAGKEQATLIEGDMGMEGGEGGPPGMGMGGRMAPPPRQIPTRTGTTTPASQATGAEERIHQELSEGRYVDDNGEPLSYQSVYPYAKHPQAEFKLMPLHMQLTMDQRHIPTLLVECANSNMPIRVDRVQMSKSSGGGGAPADSEGGMALGGIAPIGPSRIGSGGGPSDREISPYDAPVDIRGVIYIFNPPDRKKLGTGHASQAKPAEAAASASVPGGPVAPPPSP